MLNFLKKVFSIQRRSKDRIGIVAPGKVSVKIGNEFFTLADYSKKGIQCDCASAEQTIPFKKGQILTAEFIILKNRTISTEVEIMWTTSKRFGGRIAGSMSHFNAFIDECLVYFQGKKIND